MKPTAHHGLEASNCRPPPPAYNNALFIDPVSSATSALQQQPRHALFDQAHTPTHRFQQMPPTFNGNVPMFLPQQWVGLAAFPSQTPYHTNGIFFPSLYPNFSLPPFMGPQLLLQAQPPLPPYLDFTPPQAQASQVPLLFPPGPQQQWMTPTTSNRRKGGRGALRLDSPSTAPTQQQQISSTQTEIDDLKRKIAALEAKIAAHEAKIPALEAALLKDGLDKQEKHDLVESINIINKQITTLYQILYDMGKRLTASGVIAFHQELLEPRSTLSASKSIQKKVITNNCCACGKSEDVTCAHLFRVPADAIKHGCEFFHESNFIPLCGTLGKVPSCHDAFDTFQLCFISVPDGYLDKVGSPAAGRDVLIPRGAACSSSSSTSAAMRTPEAAQTPALKKGRKWIVLTRGEYSVTPPRITEIPTHPPRRFLHEHAEIFFSHIHREEEEVLIRKVRELLDPCNIENVRPWLDNVTPFRTPDARLGHTLPPTTG